MRSALISLSLGSSRRSAVMALLRMQVTYGCQTWPVRVLRSLAPTALERIRHALYVAVREQAGSEASPTVVIIDSQTAKGAQKGGPWLDPSGYDAGKKVKGRKRHSLVDTLGLLLNVVVHPADVQDRDGAFLLLRRARRLFPFIKRIFADGGYAGEKMALVVRRTGAWKLEIVKRSDVSGFEVLPKRWIVERTFAWISRNRALRYDRRRLRPPGHDPHHAQAACRKRLVLNPNFPDGLLATQNIDG